MGGTLSNPGPWRKEAWRVSRCWVADARMSGWRVSRCWVADELGVKSAGSVHCHPKQVPTATGPAGVFGLAVNRVSGKKVVLLGFLWFAIAGVAGCGASRAGLRRGSEVRRGTNLGRDPHEFRMDPTYGRSPIGALIKRPSLSHHEGHEGHEERIRRNLSLRDRVCDRGAPTPWAGPNNLASNASFS